MLMVGVGTWLFEQKIKVPAWMITVGMGLYFGYIQFNSIFWQANSHI